MEVLLTMTERGPLAFGVSGGALWFASHGHGLRVRSFTTLALPEENRTNGFPMERSSRI